MARKTAPRPTAPTRRPRLGFFKETANELRKAVWPTRRETIRLTLMVLAVSASVGAFLGALDYGFTQLSRLLFY